MCVDICVCVWMLTRAYMNYDHKPQTRSVLPTLLVNIPAAKKGNANSHFQASWASQSVARPTCCYKVSLKPLGSVLKSWDFKFWNRSVYQFLAFYLVVRIYGILFNDHSDLCSGHAVTVNRVVCLGVNSSFSSWQHVTVDVVVRQHIPAYTTRTWQTTWYDAESRSADSGDATHARHTRLHRPHSSSTSSRRPSVSRHSSARQLICSRRWSAPESDRISCTSADRLWRLWHHRYRIEADMLMINGRYVAVQLRLSLIHAKYTRWRCSRFHCCYHNDTNIAYRATITSIGRSLRQWLILAFFHTSAELV